jgi:hypothetical protein
MQNIIKALVQEMPEVANQAKKAAIAGFEIMDGLQHKNIARVIQGNEEMRSIAMHIDQKVGHIEDALESISDHIEDNLGFHLEL